MSGATSDRIGLRGRLALSIAAIVVAALTVTFFAVYRATGSQLRSRIDRDLSGESDAVARRVAAASRTPRQAAEAARLGVLAEGELNGGGPVLRLTSTGGTIYLKRR